MRTRSDVDDIVSEVFTRAWSCKDWSRIDKGRAYLFEVARNLVIDLARREKIISYDTVVDIDLLDSGHSLELQLDARDEVRRLQALLETLPIQCRKVFIARRVYGKTLAEIAEEMGLSVSTIESPQYAVAFAAAEAAWEQAERLKAVYPPAPEQAVASADD